MSIAPFARQLEHQPGVQLNPLLQSLLDVDATEPDQVFAVVARLTRGPIDRAMLVTRGDFYRKTGPKASNRVLAINEAKMQTFEALNAGALGAVVMRLAPGSAVKRYALVAVDGAQSPPPPPPPPPEFVYDISAASGWRHPVFSAGAPYIIPMDGRLLWHPGPSLERPVLAFTNTFGAGDYRIVMSTPPDAQLDSNSADVVKSGASIGTATWQGSNFDSILSLTNGEVVEITQSGSDYTRGGRYIEVEVFKIVGSGQVKVADAFSDFYANQGRPTGTWSYFYRSNNSFPNGLINSAGPMIPVGGSAPVALVQSVTPASNSLEEGEFALFTVLLSNNYGNPGLPFAITGQVSQADFRPPVFSNNVVLSGGVVSVPFGVGSFTVSIQVEFDFLLEDGELLVVSVGGVSGAAEVADVPFALDAGVLSLGFEGADGSTSFIDTSQSAIPLQMIGSVSLSTEQKAVGTSSLRNTGGGHLQGESAAIAFGTGDFTIGCYAWSATLANNGAEKGVLQFCTPQAGLLASGIGNIAIFATSTGWAFYKGTSPPLIIGPSPQANRWYKITISRTSSVMRVFIDGVKVAEFANAYDFTGTGFAVGAYYSNVYRWDGFIDRVEVFRYGVLTD